MAELQRQDDPGIVAGGLMETGAGNWRSWPESGMEVGGTGTRCLQ